MGEMSLPASALHGASTHRAVLNFPVSGYRFSRPFIRALGFDQVAAAQANHDLGLLDAERAALIVRQRKKLLMESSINISRSIFFRPVQARARIPMRTK